VSEADEEIEHVPWAFHNWAVDWPAAVALRQRTRCANGHPFTRANTRWEGSTRRCRACDRERTARLRAARRGEDVLLREETPGRG
jgi:hypothetical protein